MSSHREAPEISKDPVADNTDTYCFVSPDKPDTVTIITNYVPIETPDGGPNFYEFGEDVLYEIHIDNNGDAEDDITYQFRFTTQTVNPNTFLYNVGPISFSNGTYVNWNRPQTYSVTRVDKEGTHVLGTNLLCPPCNVGPRSTPDYANLAQAAIHTLSNGDVVFAGQRAEGFYVDLGAVFDLGDLRPFQNLHLISSPAAPGVDGTQFVNVHTIAIQIAKTRLTVDGSNPTNVDSPKSVIGVYGSASRQKTKVYDSNQGGAVSVGPFMQVSRLAEPLINEVIIPLGQKNYWNTQDPQNDSQFASHYATPELANLIPVLYPNVFPNLAKLNASKAPRVDLEAILLTGIPSGIIKGFQNYTGKTLADLIRLNMAIPPSATGSNGVQGNILGILGGDLAGFPNGRRISDDVVTIELRAIAGATYPLVAPSYKPDAAAGLVTDGVTPSSPGAPVYLDSFPYLGTPYDGYDHPSA
jgi:hypothetical protein